MSGDRTRYGRQPWLAFVLPPLAWVQFDIGLAVMLRPSCAAVGGWVWVVWGTASLLICALAARLAWTAAGAGADENPHPRSWVARIALFGSGLFALAITFQMLSAALVPSCAR